MDILHTDILKVNPLAWGGGLPALAKGGRATSPGVAVPNDTACLLYHISPESKKTQLQSLSVYSSETSESDYWLQIFRSDLKVKKPFTPNPYISKTAPSCRGNIFEFSQSSARRLLFVCRNSGYQIKSQFCCTYHKTWPKSGQESKKHLQAFIKRITRRFGKNLPWLWVLEFQQRGAPHFHFFSDVLPTPENHEFFCNAWLAVSGQKDDQDAYSFHRHVKNFFTWNMSNGSYLVKEYIGKVEQKEVPEEFQDVGRFWGNSAAMKPDYLTLNPKDFEEDLEFLTAQAVRITAKYQENIIDHKKTFGVLMRSTLDLFKVPHEQIPKKTKMMISQGIKLSSEYLRFEKMKKKTNKRGGRLSYSLPGRAETFQMVLSCLMKPLPPGGFKKMVMAEKSLSEKKEVPF